MVESISFQDTIAREKSYYFWKARVALYALLKGCGVTQGDEVIVQAFTCVAVPNPIIYAGALPVYVDIDARTFTGQANLVLERINSKTKAIILQNSFGHPPDYEGVISVARKLGIPVIADCAHGAGSSYKGVFDGTVADASIFSFQWTKPVTAGLGGCAVVINEGCFPFLKDIVKDCVDPTRLESTMLSLQFFVHSRLMTPNSYWTLVSAYRLLRKMGMKTGSSSSDETTGSEMPEGFLKNMGNPQFKAVESGLSLLEEKVKKRQEAARYYDSLCDEHGVQRAFQADYAGHSFLRYPILVNDNAISFDYAARNKIQLGEWFRTPIDPVVNLSLWGYTKGSCPVAESVCQQIINLPTDNPLSKSQFKQILN